MQILDMLIPSRLDQFSKGPHFDFEDTPEYKEMVRRATDYLQHIQDSVRAAANDSAQTVSDTIQAAVSVTGHTGGGDNTMLLILTLLGSLLALSACAYLILNINKSRKLCNC